MARQALQASQTSQTEVIDPEKISQTILDTFDGHRRDELQKLWDELPEDVRERIPALMRLELERSNSFLHDTLERSGWEGPSFDRALNNYLLQHHSDSLGKDVLDVIEFVESRGLLKGLGRTVSSQVLKRLEQERD